MTPIKLIIVGAGGRGTGYAEYALQYPDQVQIIGVAEPRAYYRQNLVNKHKIPLGNVYSDWSGPVKREKFADGVIIATPDQLHYQPALAYANLGYNILLEKPMAQTSQECYEIVNTVKNKGVIFCVCHVLRYTIYTQKLKAIVDSGRLGQIINIQHIEPVGYWHQAHSFVRGNWRNTTESTFMLMSKSCHDLDWLRYIMGKRCTKASSFGSLIHFRKENMPIGAADRCLDCKVETTCPYSAVKIYMGRFTAGELGWPLSILTPDLTLEGITQALRTGPYGRCVYACDNDVVDHQVVNLEYEDKSTASFTMTAFNRQCDRETRIGGTLGELEGDGRFIKVYDYLTDTTDEIDTEIASDGSLLSGHGGGDYWLMNHFIRALLENDKSLILSGPDETLESHYIVFAAEKSRLENRVVDINI